MDFGDILKSAANAAGDYFAGRTASQQSAASQNAAANLALIQQGNAQRQIELGAQTQQATMRYVAIGGVALVVVLLLMRNKAL
ncbi:hypothetical protein [Ferrovibrio terrae]|uniref:hypothetical protein n=1 Tax=Ferrovibrio terrae TaxID=2594003 RepID=UPI0031382C98